MDLNALLSPFDVLSSDNWTTDSATHADVVLALPNAVLLGIWGGYDHAPDTSPVLSIKNGATVKWQIPITQDGPIDPIILRPALSSEDGSSIVVTLSDGGAGVTGYLSVASLPFSPPLPVLSQEISQTFRGSANDITFVTPLTAGNSVVACISIPAVDVGGTEILVLNNNGSLVGTALTLAVSIINGTIATQIWYAHDIPAGLTHLVVDTDSENRINVNASEWQNLAAAAPSVFASNAQTNAVPQTNPAAPSGAALLIAAGAWVDDDYNTGPTNSFTRLTQIGAAPIFSLFQESAYLISGAPGSYSTGWALTATQAWAAAVAAFTPAA